MPHDKKTFQCAMLGTRAIRLSALARRYTISSLREFVYRDKNICDQNAPVKAKHTQTSAFIGRRTQLTPQPIRLDWSLSLKDDI
jgi:hypothetical protein